MIQRHGKIWLAMALSFAFPLAAQGQGGQGDMGGMSGMSAAAPACTAKAPPPPALAGWQVPHRPVAAARSLSDAGNAVVAVGQPVDAALLHTPQVAYPVQPGKPGDPASYGGVFAFDVAKGGHYRVAISGRAWTDVIEDGAALGPVSFGRAPACTGIFKMVDYSVKPGHHLLEIAAHGDPKIDIMIVSLP